MGLERLREVLKSDKARPERTDLHLLALMKFAPSDRLKKLVRDYLSAARVGYGMPVEEAAELVHAATGGRFTAAAFEKRASGFLWRKRQRVHALVSIKGADFYSTHYTVPDANGHQIIPQSVIDEIEVHRAKERTVILRSPSGTGKTERVIKSLMDSSGRAALFLPRVAVVYDASGRLSLLNYNDLCPETARYAD